MEKRINVTTTIRESTARFLKSKGLFYSRILEEKRALMEGQEGLEDSLAYVKERMKNWKKVAGDQRDWLEKNGMLDRFLQEQGLLPEKNI